MAVQLGTFEKTLDHPEKFLTSSKAIASQVTSLLKALFDHGKKMETNRMPATPLPELLVDGFDTEQVWEEVRLQHEPMLSWLERQAERLPRKAEKLAPEPVKAKPRPKQGAEMADDAEDLAADGVSREDGDLGEEESDMGEMGDGDDMEDAMEEDGGESAHDDDEDLSDDGSFARESAPATKEKLKRLVKKGFGASAPSDTVDDTFFRMADMEAAADIDDDVVEEGSDEGVDYFDGWEHEDEEAEEQTEARYADFFDPAYAASKDKKAVPLGEGHIQKAKPKKRKEQESDGDGAESAGEGEERDAAASSSDEEQAKKEAEPEPKTPHEKQRARLKRKISELEEHNMADKHWTLTGEVTARARPKDSLLGEGLEFEHATKAAPVITEDVTATIEDIIRKRISEASFDDVVRKKEVQALPRRKREELDQAKSKKGLAEIYEQEFKEAAGTASAPLSDKELEHRALEAMFLELCTELDSLSNFHYTPKPVEAEMRVVKNVPAVQIEEAIPMAVSDATVLAPTEVYTPGKKDGQSREEMSREEKKAQRRTKKRVKAKEQARKESDKRVVDRANPGLGNKHAKAKTLKSLSGKRDDGGGAGASKGKFFESLQAEVSSGIKARKNNSATTADVSETRSAVLKL